MAQCFVIDLLTAGSELANDLADLEHIPGNDGIVQDRQTTECMHLVAEFTASQHAFFAKA